MNSLLIIVLVALTGAAYAEYCAHTSDCSQEHCLANFTLQCWTRDNVCTCVPNSSSDSCTTQASCMTNHGPCTHGDHTWHCSDNRCRCSYFG